MKDCILIFLLQFYELFLLFLPLLEVILERVGQDYLSYA